MTLKFEFRDMTDSELKREQTAFDEQGSEFDNPPEKQERFGFVATEDGKFIGCSSGLAQKEKNRYGKYFYLTDLLVEKEYRKLGHGKKLLDLLENKIKSLGIEYIWTWTASYEAPNFYLKQGYEVFTTFDNFYYSGHSRMGFIKKL
jgi:ribosomal protein S18 acetylase RimI-like enzyme